MIDNLLLGNYKFRESDFTPNIDHYRDLVEAQHPKVLWLGCSDSRVNPERITGARAGEIFVQRNIGNIVSDHDWNFATVLEYAIVHLQVEEIVVCGHSDCGGDKGYGQGEHGRIHPALASTMPGRQRSVWMQRSPGPGLPTR